MPLPAMAVELEILGDMTMPHGGFGMYQNLVKFSEKFDDAAWTITNTMTRAADDSAGPDGSTTADKLSFTGAATVDALAQDSGTVSTAAAYTFSVWLKSVSGGTTVVIKIEDANENNTKVITGLSATRWERYSVSQTFATAGGNIKVTLLENAAADAPVILAWGAQLEKSSKPNVYARTTDDQIAAGAPEVGFALGKNAHITGNLEVHGSIVTHGTGGGADHTVAGNLTVNGDTTLGNAAADTVTINAGPIKLVNAIAAADALEFGSGATLANLYTSADNTLKTDDAFVVASTLGVTGATTLSSTLGVTGATTLDGGLTMDTNKFTVADTTGNTSVGGTLGVTGATTLNGGLTMDTDKFTVADTTGNTAVGGTLNVTGASTLSSTLGVTGATTLDGGLTMDTNKFTVADTTGNTAVGGTLNVTGASTLSSTLGVTGATTLDGGLTMDTNKFTVADTTGNTSVGGTLGVTGASTLSSTLAVTGATTLNGGLTMDTDKFTVADTTGNTVVGGTLTAGATTVSGDLSVRANDKMVMDSTDGGGTASDTYMVHDNTDDRIRLYVDGVEVARFKK